MANEIYLDILRSGADHWNVWRLNNAIIEIDFTGANLSGIDLSRANLSQAKLSNSDLSRANLSRANLSDTDLSQSNLAGALMSGIDLFQSRLSGAILSDCKLFEANLSEADLSGCILSNADLADAKLCGTKLSKANLYGVDLSGADLYEADLSGADLSGAFLYGTYFVGTNLDEVDLDGCSLSSTVFGLTSLGTCLGLDTVSVDGACVIDFQTLKDSGNLPKTFLIKLGLPELYIDYLPDFYDDTLTLYSSFLSHSKENRAFARKLYEALIAKGVRVFFDEKELKPGDPLGKAIQKGINHFDKTILVCSEASLKSKWVDYELELAFKKEAALTEEKGDDVNLLIPITIDDYVFQWNGDKQPQVTGRYVGDFRGWEDDARFGAALNELIHALNVNRREHIPSSFL